MARWRRWQELVLPAAIITSILVILVPLPAALMDLLLAANITVAVLVLLTTLYVATPLDFSIFPSLLLATTLGRLVLNVASTRLILTRADQAGLEAAGGVIRSFGEFVAGDRLVVGMILFVIIIVIQFVVITKGATRISEVAARFTLDAMPGRQMAIDADLNAGIIDEAEAQRRRDELTRQADFFGAMDGASKFVRGDAIAGIVITLINIVGGLIIGVLQAGMGLAEAASLYTKLTIGDGLASQIPAFLISLAAGLLVTRSSKESNLPRDFLRQLFTRPQPLLIAASFLALLVLTRLPRIPLLTLGTSCGVLALLLTRQQRQQEEQRRRREEKAQAEKQPEERVEDYLAVDPMELEIGLGLIRLADPRRGGDLLQRITRIRQTIASEIGIILPKVRICDNLQLKENQYQIRIAGNPVAEGTIFPDRWLAIETARVRGTVEGIETTEPVYGQKAWWIEPSRREEATMLGYTVVPPAAVLATHLQDVVRKHADELLTRDATRHLIEELKKRSPAVVEELIPGVMKLGEVQQVLQMLLREEVPIRNLAMILEALGDYAPKTKDPVLLTEYVRHRLARTICSRLRDDQKRLAVVTLDPSLEERIAAALEHSERGLVVRMSPQAADNLCRRIAEQLAVLTRQGRPPVLLVSPQIRAGVKQLTAARLPRLHVLAYNEVTRDTQIEAVAMVTAGPDQAAA